MSRLLYSLSAVVALVVIASVGVSVLGLDTLFGVVIPYAAVTLFIAGFLYRVLKWASSPVPFRIPTSCGQQKSLPWIKNNALDNPHNAMGALGRMALEVLTFRSLFRNTKMERTADGKMVFGSGQLLWLGALAFHYCLLIILLRHFRFFAEPVPFFVTILQDVDGFMQLWAPRLFMTSLIIVAALGYLLIRRVWNPQLRYISLPSDYFALFLLLGITISGDLMRYVTKVDVVKVKELVMSLVSFHPSVPEGIGLIFYIHLFLVCALFAYFPLSKLMHMGGVFLSPTRNLANNSRVKRHVNPWDYPVHVHTYEEWEDDFREKLIAADIPLDKE
jgi:nitrate reductase gamma subunit